MLQVTGRHSLIGGPSGSAYFAQGKNFATALAMIR